jgi:hypothetical protein
MRAHLTLELSDRSGAAVATRRATNSVMRQGAALVADLFRGAGNPITHMGVGTSDAPESDAFDTDALTNEAAGGQPALTGATEAPIPPEAFGQPQIDEGQRVVRVRFRATLPDSAAVGTVREAGLLARPETGDPVLYNRVTFAPVQKSDDHELTLFWEVSFPYGDLHWLP